MDRRELDVIGCGGHAAVIADIARRCGLRVTVWGDRSPLMTRFPPGTTFALLDELTTTCPVVLGFGDLQARRECRRRFAQRPEALVDPGSVLGHGVDIGAGTVVMPGCILNANARVAVDAIVNTGCIIEHDCVIGENTHLSPGVRLAGGVGVGDDVHVGTGAIVIPGITIGDRATVGAGAVVIHDVPPGVTVAGVPARPLHSHA